MAADAVQLGFDQLGTPLFEVAFVVVDLETTGLSPGRDRITEVGAVKVRAGEVLGEFHTLVRPDRPVPPGVTAVTGITDGMLRGAPAVAAVLPAFLEFARGTVLVAHNARFDTSFLTAELAREGFPGLDHPVVDTARLARRLLRDEVPDVRLATLARHLRARTAPEHRALTDARATVDVLHGLLERAGSLGATTLEDLHHYSRSTSDRAFRKVSLVRDAPSAPGTYRFVDARGEVLYVGKATDLRRRLRTYFGQDRRRRIADLVRETAAVEWTCTPTELEASVREVRAIVATKPRYNRRSKHPERSVWVKLTREPFPRLSITSVPPDGEVLHLGPLTSRRAAQSVVDAMHEALPLRQCTMRIRLAQDHPTCVLKDLGRCGAPCDGTQSRDGYTEVVEQARQALTADPSRVLDTLRDRMSEQAGRGRYERAAELRQRLHVVADALAAARRLDLAGRVAEVAAARPSDPDTEVALIRHGRLTATVRVPGPIDDATALEALRSVDEGCTLPGSAGPHEAEELRLVRDWLDAPGVRVLWVEGTLAEPCAGGAVLHRTRREARRVARQAGRDRQLLGGAKVVRRDPSDAQATTEPGASSASGSSRRTVPSGSSPPSTRN